MSKKFVAIAGAVGVALAVATALQDDPFEGQTCALSPDGAVVATTDGKNFHHLNAPYADTHPELGYWQEGKAGWGGGDICATTDAEFDMPRKEFPANGRVVPREPSLDF